MTAESTSVANLRKATSPNSVPLSTATLAANDATLKRPNASQDRLQRFFVFRLCLYTCSWQDPDRDPYHIAPLAPEAKAKYAKYWGQFIRRPSFSSPDASPATPASSVPSGVPATQMDVGTLPHTLPSHPPAAAPSEANQAVAVAATTEQTLHSQQAAVSRAEPLIAVSPLEVPQPAPLVSQQAATAEQSPPVTHHAPPPSADELLTSQQAAAAGQQRLPVSQPLVSQQAPVTTPVAGAEQLLAATQQPTATAAGEQQPTALQPPPPAAEQPLASQQPAADRQPSQPALVSQQAATIPPATKQPLASQCATAAISTPTPVAAVTPTATEIRPVGQLVGQQAATAPPAAEQPLASPQAGFVTVAAEQQPGFVSQQTAVPLVSAHPPAMQQLAQLAPLASQPDQLASPQEAAAPAAAEQQGFVTATPLAAAAAATAVAMQQPQQLMPLASHGGQCASPAPAVAEQQLVSQQAAAMAAATQMPLASQQAVPASQQHTAAPAPQALPEQTQQTFATAPLLQQLQLPAPASQVATHTPRRAVKFADAAAAEPAGAEQRLRICDINSGSHQKEYDLAALGDGKEWRNLPGASESLGAPCLRANGVCVCACVVAWQLFILRQGGDGRLHAFQKFVAAQGRARVDETTHSLFALESQEMPWRLRRCASSSISRRPPTQMRAAWRYMSSVVFVVCLRLHARRLHLVRRFGQQVH